MKHETGVIDNLFIASQKKVQNREHLIELINPFFLREKMKRVLSGANFTVHELACKVQQTNLVYFKRLLRTSLF